MSRRTQGSWSEERVDLLRRLWPDMQMSRAEIAHYLGVTEAAAESARRRYGLPPRPEGANHRPFKRKKALVAPRRVVSATQHSAVLESSIPWPSRERLMARR